ncbi:MAG: hypothetical protein JSW11_18725 [Candidatus Heimdallarchaeota archaeon]|nr:MAG: hypothetical protein JSW11_18725 [Candidatus Heimdallarchaeota archaeon]
MSDSRKSSKTGKKSPNNTLPSTPLVKKRFKRGFKRYVKKNYSYGWKAFAHRIQYRKEVWAKASPIYFILLIIATIVFAIISFLNLEDNPVLFSVLMVLFFVTFLLEIWYVGGRKVPRTVGRKIRRKKKEREAEEDG